MPEPTDPSALGTIVLWAGTGVLLAWLGLRMNLLEGANPSLPLRRLRTPLSTWAHLFLRGPRLATSPG